MRLLNQFGIHKICTRGINVYLKPYFRVDTRVSLGFVFCFVERGKGGGGRPSVAESLERKKKVGTTLSQVIR